jgi:acyl-CoA thioesterase-1
VAVFLGDSYTAASEQGSGYALRTAVAMDWAAVLERFGGTGYVTAGQLPGGAPYADRLDEVVADDPDVVLVQGSTNDICSPVAAVGAAAEDLYAELQRRLPAARLVVLGPTAPPGVDRAAALAVRDAVEDAADGAGVPFVDPIAQGWLTPADGLYADPIHPNQAGYGQLADDLVEALRDEGF